MITPVTNQAAPAGGKPQLFKSKKELVMLAVASVVFVFVIWKMYLSKGGRTTGPADPVPDVVGPAAPVAVSTPAPVAAGGTGAATTPAELLASLDLVLAEGRTNRPAPVRLPRDPFAMTQAMEQAVQKIVPKSRSSHDSSQPVVVTPDDVKKLLATIPGAGRAARKGFRVGAVMISDAWKGATINGRVVPVGHKVLGFKLVEVDEDSVVLERGKHRIRLLIRSRNSFDQDDEEENE